MSSDVSNHQNPAVYPVSLLSSAETVLVEPSRSIDLKEVPGRRTPGHRTPGRRSPSPTYPSAHRRSPRLRNYGYSDSQNSGSRRASPSASALHADKEKSPGNVSTRAGKMQSPTSPCCVKITFDSQEEQDGNHSRDSHDKSIGAYHMSNSTQELSERESAERYQSNKSDVLSVVIEKLTELVENSEREQKEKASNSDSEESSGASTPKGVVHRGRSPARSRRSKLYKCPNCPCLFAVTKRQLQKKNPPLCLCCEKVRNAKIPPEAASHEQGSVLCEVCPYRALDYQSLLQHLATHPKADVYKCVLCDYVTTLQKSIMEHQATHVRPTPARKYQCNDCNYFTTELADLQTHLKRHNKQGELLLKCSDCGYSCKCEDTLRRHMWKHVSSSREENQDAITSKTSSSRTGDKLNLYKCLLCGYLCEKLCTLKAHAWRHAGERECSYPVVDDDENLKRSVSQGNKSDKHLETETVSEIAVGCCGDNGGGCCSMGREQNKTQCQCPSIAIPSTSVTALQKLAVNTGYKRSKSPRHTSENLKLQGNSILSSEVLSKLISGGANNSLDNQSSNLLAVGKQSVPSSELACKDTHDIDSFVPGIRKQQFQVIPIDIPPDVQIVQDEIEIATTEASPKKDGLKGDSPVRRALPAAEKVSRNLQMSSNEHIVSRVDDSISTKTSFVVPMENNTMKTTAAKSLSEPEKMDMLKVVTEPILSLSSKGSGSTDIHNADCGDDDVVQSSDAMKVLSSLDGGCCVDIPSPSNMDDARKRKLDTSDLEDDGSKSSIKRPCLEKTATLPSSDGSVSPSAILTSATEISINDSNKTSLPMTGSLPSTISKLANSLLKQYQGESHLKETPSASTIDQEGALPAQLDLSSIQGHNKSNLFSIQGQKAPSSCPSLRFTESKDSSPDLMEMSESDLKQHGISESLLTVIEKFREETESGGKNSYYCPVCGHKANTSNHLKEHIQLCHCKGQLKCSKCPAVFYTQSKLDVHSAQHDTTENQTVVQKDTTAMQKESQSKGNNVCENCDRIFIGINAMSTHKRSCMAQCNLQKESGDEKENDLVAQFNKWECPKCIATFDKKTHWLSHLEGHSKNLNNEEQEHDCVKCPTCSREFVGTFALSIHKRSCMKKRWYGCPECDYSAPTSMELSNHIAVHRKPYKCELCAYTSASVSGIRNHMKFHSTEKPYKCGICDFRGAYPQSLRSHMKAHQTFFPSQTETVEQFKCKLCGYICNHLPSLKSHMWRHASDPNYNYDIINDAINAVMDGLGTTPTIKTINITQANPGADNPLISTSSQPINIAAKTSADRETSSTPQLIMIKTGVSSRPKMVMVSKHPAAVTSSQGDDGQKDKVGGGGGIEYGMTILKCSECSFQCVSKEEMFLHVTEHQK